MTFVDEDGKERCCRVWWRDYCDCVTESRRRSRARSSAPNKIKFGHYKGTAYFSIPTDYLKVVLSQGVDDKLAEQKIIEVLRHRKCDIKLTESQKIPYAPNGATEKQKNYIACLEREAGKAKSEQTDTSRFTLEEASNLIQTLLAAKVTS